MSTRLTMRTSSTQSSRNFHLVRFHLWMVLMIRLFAIFKRMQYINKYELQKPRQLERRFMKSSRKLTERFKRVPNWKNPITKWLRFTPSSRACQSMFVKNWSRSRLVNENYSLQLYIFNELRKYGQIAGTSFSSQEGVHRRRKGRFPQAVRGETSETFWRYIFDLKLVHDLLNYSQKQRLRPRRSMKFASLTRTITKRREKLWLTLIVFKK